MNQIGQREQKRTYDRKRYLRQRTERVAAKPPEPISLLDETTIAYLAGLTDADGSIFVTHTNRLRTVYPAVVWAMTHKPTIEHVARLIGNKAVVANNRPSPSRGFWSVPTLKTQWKTQVNGSRAQLLCRRMLPYLITKKAQAELVCEFPCDARKAPGVRLPAEIAESRRNLGERISALNHA